MPGRARRAVVAVGVVWCASCGSTAPADGAPADVEPVDPAARAVEITTTACGHASRTGGSGVVVGERRVLTAAHVVVGAGTVMVTHASRDHEARLVHLDVTRDLALLDAADVGLSAVEIGDVAAGEQVTIVDAASSGSVDAVVRRRVVIDIDEVRGTERHERDGYELDATISSGDSGAGVFDARGRLAAIVFAEPTERDGITYAVGGAELDAVLGAEERRYECRPDLSRVVEVRATTTVPM